MDEPFQTIFFDHITSSLCSLVKTRVKMGSMELVVYLAQITGQWRIQLTTN